MWKNRLLLISSLILSTCGRTPIYAQMQPSARDVIDMHCVFCHHVPGAPLSVDLNGYDKVVKFVTPGDPISSRLIKMMTGMNERGLQMPPYYPLDWYKILAVERWIMGGATKTGYEEKMVMSSMGGDPKKKVNKLEDKLQSDKRREQKGVIDLRKK